MKRVVSLLLAALVLTSCNSPIGIMLGFGHAPIKPTVTVDILCDFDAGGHVRRITSARRSIGCCRR